MKSDWQPARLSAGCGLAFLVLHLWPSGQMDSCTHLCNYAGLPQLTGLGKLWTGRHWDRVIMATPSATFVIPNFIWSISCIHCLLTLSQKHIYAEGDFVFSPLWFQPLHLFPFTSQNQEYNVEILLTPNKHGLMNQETLDHLLPGS
jgi:hypothetical protein